MHLIHLHLTPPRNRLTMATHNHFPSILFISLTLTISSAFSAGITVDLIHRDSLSSPLSPNSAASHIDKFNDAIRRSISRAHYLTNAASRVSPAAEGGPRVIPEGGEYLLDLAIGTPPTRFLGILDTGSDLTWTQCAPCVQCFEQESPIYDPSKSSSFLGHSCNANACAALPTNGRGCTNDNTCAYKYGYGDSSYSTGELGLETITFGDSLAGVSNFTFGCGHDNKGSFRSPGTGLLGFGQGPLSLVAQTKNIDEFGGKFAYCLVPFEGEFKETVSSKISFGQNAVISGSDVVSTPVITGTVDTFSYLTLESISVGSKAVSFKNSYGTADLGDESTGNIIIDSGTTLTFLPSNMFDDFVSEIQSQIKADPVSDPSGQLQLCYQGNITVPKVTVQFTGASLELSAVNVFGRVSEDVVCLLMLAAGDTALYGNMAQQNFVVAHDLDGKTVSFKPTECSTYVGA